MTKTPRTGEAPEASPLTASPKEESPLTASPKEASPLTASPKEASPLTASPNAAKPSPEALPLTFTLIRALLKAYIFLFYRLKIEGLENVPLSGKALVCPNHVSGMDMIFIGIRLKRLVRWMAKAELWRYFGLRSIINLLGAFPVNRGKGDVGAIRTAINLLKEGELVGIFAEGHRGKSKIEGGYRIHAGAAMLAIKTCTPVIPVGIEGGVGIFSKARVVFGESYNINASCEKEYSHAEYVVYSTEIITKAYGLVGQKILSERGSK